MKNMYRIKELKFFRRVLPIAAVMVFCCTGLKTSAAPGEPPITGPSYVLDVSNTVTLPPGVTWASDLFTFGAGSEGLVYEVVGTTTTNTIIIPTGRTVTLILNGVSITDVKPSPLSLDGANVTIWLKDGSINTFKTLKTAISPGATSAIGVPATATLTINGGGKNYPSAGILNATAGQFGAGIGGHGGVSGSGSLKDCGTVTINGGVVNATGGDGSGTSPAGAGIGGGSGDSGGSGADINGGNGGIVTINGGIVTAKGGVGGSAGIGGGHGYELTPVFATSGGGGNVTINGGSVVATGGTTGGAGIGGGGTTGSSANITISNTATVKAYSFGYVGSGGNKPAIDASNANIGTYIVNVGFYTGLSGDRGINVYYYDNTQAPVGSTVFEEDGTTPIVLALPVNYRNYAFTTGGQAVITNSTCNNDTRLIFRTDSPSNNLTNNVTMNSTDNDIISMTNPAWRQIWYSSCPTVTFNTHGGTPIEPQRLPLKGLIQKPTDPTKGSDVFGGWVSVENSATLWDFDHNLVSSLGGDRTLYARWIYIYEIWNWEDLVQVTAKQGEGYSVFKLMQDLGDPNKNARFNVSNPLCPYSDPEKRKGGYGYNTYVDNVSDAGGTGWVPLVFSQEFDGNKNTINDLWIHRSKDSVGLFGYTNRAYIHHLGVNLSDKGIVANGMRSTTSPAFTPNGIYYIGAGALVGVGEFTYIENCYSTGPVTGGYCVGGLVGALYTGYGPDCHVKNCYSVGSVKGSSSVGGFAGFNNNSETKIINCYSLGSVEIPSSWTSTGEPPGSPSYLGSFIGSGWGNNGIDGCIGVRETSTLDYGFSYNSGGYAAPYPGNYPKTVGVDTAYDIKTYNNTGVTTSEWESWDINEPSSPWAMVDGETFPYLKWQAEKGLSNAYTVKSVTYSVNGGSNDIYGTDGCGPVVIPAQGSNVVFTVKTAGADKIYNPYGLSVPLNGGTAATAPYTTFKNDQPLFIGFMSESGIIGVKILGEQYTTDYFCAGDSVTLVAEIEDKKPELTYEFQWYKNNLPVGINDSIYGLRPNDGDSIYCKVWVDEECSDTTKTNFVILKSNPIPIPPIVSTPYQVCSGTIMKLNEVPVQGTNIKWYAIGKSLVDASNTNLAHDNIYYATQTVNGCESDQSYVKFSEVDPTELDSLQIVSPQKLCLGGGAYHISDILLPQGTTAVWYDQSVGGNLLASTDPVASGTTYYAARLVGSCESTKRTPVLINTANPDFSSTTDTQYFCQGAMIKDIRMPIDHIVWYKSQTSTEPLDVAFVLEHDSNYYAEIDIDGGTCTSLTRMEVNIKIEPSNYKYALDTQTFAAGAKVMDIVASGYGLEWYKDKELQNHLNLSDPLKNDSTYYAVSSTSTCGIISVAVTAKLDLAIELNLTVFLQGPLAFTPVAGKMTYYIQHNPTGQASFWTPKLPVTNPYGLSTEYAQINNIAGPADTVVDWILVEIWDNNDIKSNTKTLLESQALLLKPDGRIVNTAGEAPVFTLQDDSVRIVIKHRNHLSIMSDSVFSFKEKIEYDFSTGLKKALRLYADPPPMVLIGGKWCMYAGDLDGDNYIGNDDVTIIDLLLEAPIEDEYIIEDVTMRGYPDTDDRNMINSNAKKALISPVLYFE